MYLHAPRSGFNISISDTALIEKYKNSLDNTALIELFQRHSDMVYTVCRKYLKRDEDCKDTAFEIFEGVAEKLKFWEIQDFRSWLFIVAKNHCLMKVRQRVSYESVFAPGALMNEPANEDIEWELIRQIDVGLQMEAIDAALTELDEEQRVCLQLFYFEEKRYQEIAELTKLDLKQVKSHLQNGKRNLKKRLLQRRVFQDAE